MLEKLAKQTAIYGISTIVVRFLNYLLTPYFTRVFDPGIYGITVDVYALIPFALVILTMGMESGYFRFAAKADEAGGDVTAAKRRLFATTWGITSLAALLFFGLVTLFRTTVSEWMGADYAANPDFVVWVAAIIFLDVCTAIPFARLREQGRALTYVGFKAFSVVITVVLAVAFGLAGFYETSFGVGWVFVGNLIASLLTLLAILTTTNRTLPRIDGKLLRRVLVYSLPLMVSGIAGTANEFIYPQMIKYLVPEGAMGEVGIYGAIVKIGMVLMLFVQMYRLAAEPFFLADYKKSDFLQMNAAALKYYVLVSMFIFLGIAFFRDLFGLIVGKDFREGIGILPVVLGANVLNGVWLNLSFWYKREERTSLAIVVTFVGLIFTIGCSLSFIPRWGYYGAAWARLVSEAAMVAVSFWLNRRFYPMPYQTGRILGYVALALVLYGVSVVVDDHVAPAVLRYACYAALLLLYFYYAVRREKIDLRALVRSAMHRGINNNER